MKAKRIIGGVAITFCVVILIWFGGWVVWTQFHLWDTMQNVEYQNMLFVLMALAFIMGIGFTMKKRNLPVTVKSIAKEHQLEVNKPLPENPLNVHQFISEWCLFRQKVDEISEKVADIHVIMKFLKEGKEKAGEKT